MSVGANAIATSLMMEAVVSLLLTWGAADTFIKLLNLLHLSFDYLFAAAAAALALLAAATLARDCLNA